MGGVGRAAVFLGGLVGEVGEVGEVGDVGDVGEVGTISNWMPESPRAYLNSLIRLFLSVMKSTSLTLKSGRCV